MAVPKRNTPKVELRRCLIREIDLKLNSLERNLNGASSGYGLRDSELAAAQDLLEELRHVVYASPLVLRNAEIRDGIVRHVEYVSQFLEHGGPKADTAFLAFKRKAGDGRIFSEREKTQLLDDARELYLPSKRPSR